MLVRDMVDWGGRVIVEKTFPLHLIPPLIFRLYQDCKMLSVLKSKIHFCKVEASSTLVEKHNR